MKKFSELEFAPPLWDDGFRHIPQYLFEQVVDINIDLDKLYKAGPLFIQAGAIIFPLIDPQHIIKGILWISPNLIEDILYVQLLSVDREYQTGEAMDATAEFLKKTGKTIRWATTKPKVFEEKGYKRAKSVLMELKQNGELEQTDTEETGEPVA